MTYDPLKLRLYKLHGGARLGWTFQLGVSRLPSRSDATYKEPQKISVPFSSLSLSSGYTIGEHGELSIDPGVCNIGFTKGFKGNVTQPVPALSKNVKTELWYDDILLFAGIVTKITVHTEVSDDPRYRYVHQYNYEVSSFEALLLQQQLWLPVFSGSIRAALESVFVVSWEVADSHMSWIDGNIEDLESLSSNMTLLEFLRAFSQFTRLGIRLDFNPITPEWNHITVFDGHIEWSDQATVVTTGLEDVDSWSYALDYETGSSVTLLPSGLDVRNNDIRLLGGTSVIVLPLDPLNTFQLGSSRLGSRSGPASNTLTATEGFRPPGVIDALGQKAIVTKVTHSFVNDWSEPKLGKYTCSVDTAPPLQLRALRSEQQLEQPPDPVHPPTPTLPATADLLVWLKATDLTGTLSPGDNVITWPDDTSSTWGDHVTAYAPYPTYEDSQTPAGGPCVRFFGSGGYDLPAGFAGPSAEIFIVMRADSDTLDNPGGFQSGGNDRSYHPFTDGNIYNGSFTGTRYMITGVNAGTWHIFNISHDGTTWTCRINNVSLASHDTPFQFAGRVMLGAVSSYAWNGRVAEAIGYKRSLTDSERVDAYNYLHNRHWGV